MKLLVVNVLPENNEEALRAVEELKKSASEMKLINAYEKKISPCVGCNLCWLKTPGICSIKDDYEEIMKGFLEYDKVIFLTGTALNFVDHRMKNLIDRIMPLVTMHIRIVDGECRHVPRYDREYRFGIMYSGAADRDYLEEWLNRVMINISGKRLGVYPIENVKEAVSCIL